MPASPEQQKIILHPVEEHAVVLAVAGSGKSFTMGERIAYLIEAKRVDPDQIIAVMFNRTAMEEFTEKLHKRLGKRLSPRAVTFHQMGTICLSWLVKGGFAQNWTFDANPVNAQRFCVEVIGRECSRRGYKWPRMIADTFLGFVDRVKSDLKSPEQVFLEGEWADHFSWFIQMYPLYEEARASAGLRFFSDLIYDPVMIMEASPEAAAHVADRYGHIIIDEFQDICESQYRMMRFVAGSRARVMVVGDDDQTIYSWRGAKPEYILRGFAADYQGAWTYKLTRTWRYGHALSCAANYVISNNENRADKLCVSGDMAPETHVKLHWDDGEGRVLVKLVREWVESGRKLSEIAVLVRTYGRSYESQFAMLQQGIPFRLEGGDNVSVLDNPWVAALLGWMEIAAGRFANRPYAGEPDSTTIFRLKRTLGAPPMMLAYDATNDLCIRLLKNPRSVVAFTDVAEIHADGMPLTQERLRKRALVWREVIGMTNQDLDAIEVLRVLLDRLRIVDEIKSQAKSEDAAEDQLRLIEAFHNYVATSPHIRLTDFLDHIQDLRTFSERAKNETDAVHMTSIHRSKGLEWPCVIMPSLVDGGFPHFSRQSSGKIPEEVHIEDERRLFYVAMTRAQQFLHMLAPTDGELHNWLRAGRTGYPEESIERNKSASRFLYESNLILSSTMPLMLKTPRALRAAHPELYNKYLDELDFPYSVQRID